MRPWLVSLTLVSLCCCSAQAQVVLRHKVDEGAKHTYEISQFVSELKSKDHLEECDTGLVISIENGKRDSQGHIRQAVKFESLRNNYEIRRDLGNSTLSYDSATKAARVDPPGDEFRGMGFFLDVFKVLLGARYTVVIDKDNHVAAIEGVPEILNKASPRAARWLGGLGSQIRAERLQAAHEQVLKRFPDKTLEVGDTWEQEGLVEIYLVGPIIKVARQYEYLGTEERRGQTLDKIRWTETKIVERPANRVPDARRPANGKLEQTVVESKGALYFDRVRGIEVESTHFLHIRKTAPDRLIDMKIETSQRLRD